MNESLKSQLTAADPARESNDAQTGDLVRRMSVDAYQAASLNTAVSRVPWWRRRPGVALLAIGGVLALTGAAVAIPLTLWVGGTQVDLDAKIPIAYTTDTGVEVTCEYGIYLGLGSGTRLDRGSITGQSCAALSAGWLIYRL
jgi:hypothetical protein